MKVYESKIAETKNMEELSKLVMIIALDKTIDGIEKLTLMNQASRRRLEFSL